MQARAVLLTLALLAATLVAPTAAARWRITIVIGNTPGDMVFTAKNLAAGIAGFNPTQQIITNLGEVEATLTDAISAPATVEDVALFELSNPIDSTGGNLTDPLVIEFETDLDQEPTLNVTKVNGTDVDYKDANGQDNTHTIDIPPDVPETITPVDEDDNTKLILAIVFGILGALLLLALIGLIIYRKYYDDDDEEKHKPDPNESGMPLTLVPHERGEPVSAWQDSPKKPEPQPTPAPAPEPIPEPEPEPEPVDEPLQQGGHLEPAPETEPAPAEAKPRDSIADERARYLWNASANAVADPEPGGDIPVPKMAYVEPPADDGPKEKRSSIASARAQYRWNATANAVADAKPGGDVPVAKMANVQP